MQKVKKFYGFEMFADRVILKNLLGGGGGQICPPTKIGLSTLAVKCFLMPSSKYSGNGDFLTEFIY